MAVLREYQSDDNGKDSEANIQHIVPGQLQLQLQYRWIGSLNHIVPIYLQGLFTRNRFWVAIFAAVHPDPLSVRFLTRLRKRYGAEQIFVRVGTTTMLLVTDVDSI